MAFGKSVDNGRTVEGRIQGFSGFFDEPKTFIFGLLTGARGSGGDEELSQK